VSWLYLLLAGVVEAACSQNIRPTQSFTRPVPTMVCVILGATSVYLLSHAMRDLPVGTAYAVFTGIGAIGLGVALYHDPLTPPRLLSLPLIVAGVLTTRFLSG
jgi:quaternary ammonium compound-resistance protein SugE